MEARRSATALLVVLVLFLFLQLLRLKVQYLLDTITLRHSDALARLRVARNPLEHARSLLQVKAG